jgi:hypothetical protein
MTKNGIDDESEEPRSWWKYIGTLPLHCALLKMVKLYTGIIEKSGAHPS